MRKYNSIFGKPFMALSALALVSALALASCWTTPGSNEATRFEGRWIDPVAINEYGFEDFSYTFNGSAFVLRVSQGGNPGQTYIGTFKYTDSKIRFTSGKQTWTQRYTLNGNELNLIMSFNTKWDGVAPVAGSFFKQ